VNRARNRCYDGWHVGVIHCRHSPSERHTVGVVGGDINQKIVSVLTNEYDLVRANMEFKNLAPADARRALEYKEVSAILIVILLTEISVDGAWSLSPKHESDSGSDPYRIRGNHRGECARLRKLRRAERHTAGAPAVPDDDLTTLRVSFYLGGQQEARQRSGCQPDPVATQRAQGP